METPRRTLLNRLGHGLLTLFVFFHLFCVLLVPAGNNYVGWLVAPYIEPYVRMLAMGSTWGFFSPDPGPAPLVIEYEALAESGSQLTTGRWPDHQDQIFFRERRTWRVTLARWTSMTPRAAEDMFGPMLCRQIPGAFQLRLWAVEFGTPSLLDVRDGKRHVGDEVEQQRRFLGTAYCPSHSNDESSSALFRATGAGKAGS